MSKGARRLMVKGFFHCYHLTEIVKSKGMYSFMPRSPMLRLVCNTLNSNKNWKSRYFFMGGDEWMCHLGDQECMPIDKTQGIMPSSSKHLYVFRCLVVLSLIVTLTIFLLQLRTILKSHLKNGVFWKFFLIKPSCQRGRGQN